MNRGMIAVFCAGALAAGATSPASARLAGNGPAPPFAAPVGFFANAATLAEPNPSFRASASRAGGRPAHSIPPCLEIALDERFEGPRDPGDRMENRTENHMERRGRERADQEREGREEARRRGRGREHGIHHGGRNWARDWNDFDRGFRGNGPDAGWSKYQGERYSPRRDYGGGDIDGPPRGLGLPYWAPN